MALTVDDLNRLLKSGDDALKQLRAGAAYRLVARNERGGSARIDGYPTRSMGGGSSGGDISDPTYSTVERRRKHPDPDAGRDEVADVVADLEHKLRAFTAAAWAAVKLAAKGDELAATDSRKRPPADCLACTRPVLCNGDDTLRAGHCAACDTAWRRYQETERAAGREPDLVQFRHQRPKVT